MTSKNTAVFGIYKSAEHAERAVNTLIGAGYASSTISVLLPDRRSTREFAHEKDTKAPEGATAGVTAGGVVGGTLGVLVGIGALAIPGVGPLIAAGPIMAALGGAAIGAAAGGLVGTLVGMGIPEYEAKRYESKIREGRILLSVHTEDSGEAKRAREIFDRDGAEDISTAGEASVKDKDDRARSQYRKAA